MAIRRNKDVKAWLWRYRDAVREYRRLSDEYKQLTEGQEGPKAIRYDKGTVPAGGGNDADLSSLMATREKLERKAADANSEMLYTLAERLEAIDTLPTCAMREVISMRYIQLSDGKAAKWEDIADRMSYSMQRIFEIHGQALDRLSETVIKRKRKE